MRIRDYADSLKERWNLHYLRREFPQRLTNLKNTNLEGGKVQRKAKKELYRQERILAQPK